MSYSNYKKAIHNAMLALARKSNVIFLGQQVYYQDFYGTLDGVPLSKRLEMPVAEEMQTGIAIGLALEGFLPVSIYQRMDFLPRAFDQILNHLDKIERLSCGLHRPKVIIRTTIGSRKPLDTGLQHSQDLTEIFKVALSFPVVKVTTSEEVRQAYRQAMDGEQSIMIIELQDLYNESK
jgi:pyruvate/2-oxoglutarate/acetoin dehydrogenase E1 component